MGETRAPHDEPICEELMLQMLLESTSIGLLTTMRLELAEVGA